MNYSDLIPSDDVRKFVEKNDCHLNREQKHRLICNSNKPQKQRLHAMARLMEDYPDDPVLQEKIADWVAAQQELTDWFFQKDDSAIYGNISAELKVGGDFLYLKCYPIALGKQTILKEEKASVEYTTEAFLLSDPNGGTDAESAVGHVGSAVQHEAVPHHHGRRADLIPRCAQPPVHLIAEIRPLGAQFLHIFRQRCLGICNIPKAGFRLIKG